MRIMLITLRKGAALHAHQVEGPSSIQLLRGKLRITTENGDVDIAAMSLITLAVEVIRTAMALQDCAMLLTIIKP
jgi:quercetin dioxygenase-like cupin family protein